MRAPIIGGHRRAYRPRMPARLPAAPTWRRTLAALLLALMPRSNRFMAGLSFKAMLAAMQLADSGLAGDPFEESGPDDYPVWQFMDTEREPPSVANLSRDLTINGTTVPPTFWYKAEDSSSSLVAEVGTDLAEAGGGSLAYAQGCPLMGTDTAITYDGTGYHQDSGTTYGNAGTNDLLLALAYKHTGTTSVFLAKRNGVVGYEFGVDASDRLYFTLQDSSGSTTVVSAALALGSHNYAWLAADRSGSAQWHVNSATSGSAVVISGRALTLDSATALTVGADSGGASQFDSNVIMLALWQGAAWLDSHTQTTIHAEQFRALTGTRPQIAAGSSVPNTMSRNSVAYIEKYNTSTSETELYKVGAHWPKIWKRKDKNGVVGIYYWPETAATNLQVESETLDAATWSKSACSITNTSTTTLPNGETSVNDVIHEDGTPASTHYITDENNVIATNKYIRSAWFSAINRDWARLVVTRTTGGNVDCYFDAANGVVGTPTNCDDQGMEPWRGGWHCWIALTANDTEAANCIIYIAETNGDVTFDGLDQDSLYCWGVKFEEGTYPSSYITTGAAAATRLKDEMQHPALANVGGVGSEKQGAVVCDVLMPDIDTPSVGRIISLSDGTPAADRIFLYVGTSDVPTLLTRASGGSDGSITATTDVSNGIKHTIASTWKTDRADLFVDGAGEGTPDTDIGIPDELDVINVGQDNLASPVGQLKGGLRNIRIYRRYQHGTRWAA